MFIAPLFTIVKIWKQPKCPSRDEWIKKMWQDTHACARACTHTHTHNEILLSYQKNEMLPLVASSMDLEVIVTSEISSTKTNTV